MDRGRGYSSIFLYIRLSFNIKFIFQERLESKNIVESYWSDEHTSGGKRKYYHITDEGREFLKIKKEEWQFIKKVMDQFLDEVSLSRISTRIY